MIDWVYKYKYTRSGINHLTKYIMIISAVVYTLKLFGINLTGLLMFNADAILHGQVWRLVTFIFLAPVDSLLFALFMFYFYYILGESLEQLWGSFGFTVYYILNVVVCAVIGLITGGTIVNSYYINLAMFLAFGFSNPDSEMMLFMIFPIKVKYLSWIYVGFEILWVIVGATLADKLIPLCGLISFVIFFWPDLLDYIKLPDIFPKRKSKNPVLKAVHKCEVCGRTEIDDPNLDFRFCSGCYGYHEYCNEHIYSHEHKETQ